MAKCPKCNAENDYDILDIMDMDYEGDCIIAICDAKCFKCDTEFLVKEFYDFNRAETIKGV